MTLEVRQLVLKASVSGDPAGKDAGSADPGCASDACSAGRWEDTDPDQFREDILAACRQWMREFLRQQAER